jgi:hypothetical protein
MAIKSYPAQTSAKHIRARMRIESVELPTSPILSPFAAFGKLLGLNQSRPPVDKKTFPLTGDVRSNVD